MRPRRIRSLPAVLLLALAACGGNAATTAPPSGPAPQPMPAAATGPAAAVEGFLAQAAARNYMGMAQLFGTVEGPISSHEPGPQVERRMYAIANIVHNDRFMIRGQQNIPGRGPEALQLTVSITQGGQTKDVPFVVVRSNAGNWRVEQIDLQVLTRSE